MEILFSIVVSSLTSIVRGLSKKFGKEPTKKAIALLVLVLSVGAALLYERGIISVELIEYSVRILLIAVGYYELVYKKILSPVFNATAKKVGGLRNKK